MLHHSSRSTAAPSVAPGLVVRVGIVRHRRIVRQQRVPVIGETWVGPEGVGDASGGLRLVPTGAGLQLVGPPGLPLRIGRAGDVRRCITAPGTGVDLRVDDQVRIDLGPVVVLLHVRPGRAPDAGAPFDMERFRPLLVEPGDPVFLGLLSFWGAVAGALLVVAASAPPEASAAIFEPPERILVMLRPPPDPPQQPVAVPEGVPEREAPPPALAEREVPDDVAPAPSPPGTRAERAAALLERSAVLDGLSSLRRSLRAGPSESALDAALDGIEGPAPIAAKGGLGGLRSGRTGEGRHDAGLGLPGPTRGARRGGERETVEPVPATEAPRARAGAVSIPRTPTTPTGVVERVQRVYSARLKRCYERRLAEVPSLRGRVELSFDLEGGVVAYAAVSDNETGDEGLATCIERSTDRWRFDADAAGAFVLPMVFEPG